MTIAGDASSGLAALGYARTLLRMGRSEIVLAGAVDAPGHALLDVAPGAGAAVLALAASPVGLVPLAQLGPVVTAPDYHLDPADHAAARPAVAQALAATGVKDDDIDAVITSGAVPPPSHDVRVLSIEAMAGWVCAAAGAIAVSAATQMISADEAKHVLCVSADDSGAYAAVVVSAPDWGGGA